jgi:hypothetical protein
VQYVNDLLMFVAGSAIGVSFFFFSQAASTWFGEFENLRLGYFFR